MAKIPAPTQLPDLGETVQCEGYKIELRQCKCCDPAKMASGHPRYIFTADDGTLLAICRSIPRMAKFHGWENYICKHENVTTDQEGTVYCEDCRVDL